MATDDKHRAANRLWSRNRTPESRRASNQRYGHNATTADRLRTDPDYLRKRRARAAVRRAVKRGDLTPAPCSTCGATDRVHAHHHDYDQQLAVTWLCVRCHAKHHRQYE